MAKSLTPFRKAQTEPDAPDAPDSALLDELKRRKARIRAELSDSAEPSTRPQPSGWRSNSPSDFEVFKKDCSAVINGAQAHYDFFSNRVKTSPVEISEISAEIENIDKSYQAQFEKLSKRGYYISSPNTKSPIDRAYQNAYNKWRLTYKRLLALIDQAKKQSSEIPEKPLGLDERLNELEAFAKEHAGEGVANFARQLFPELTPDVATLKAEAAAQGEVIEKAGTATSSDHFDDAGKSGPQPLRWQDRVERSRGQDPIPFLREQYAAELEQGITIGQLRMMDDLLGRAVERWAQKNPLPADLKLDMRTRQQRNNDELREVEQARLEGRNLSFTEREAKRLREAERRREK